MTRMFASASLALTALAMLPALAVAHVSISPRESMAGSTQKYTVQVPTESNVATVAAEVEIPDGVTVEAVAIPNGWKHEVKRKDDRIVAIVWTMNIPPGEFAEFSFIARNPRDKAEIVWQLRQRFADGTLTDFTKGPNGIRPSAVTKLTPRPAQ